MPPFGAPSSSPRRSPRLLASKPQSCLEMPDAAAPSAAGPATQPRLLQLPTEIVNAVVAAVAREEPDERAVRGLLSCQAAAKALAEAACCERLWATLWAQRFGAATKLHEAARKLAGGWQALYKSKVVSDKAAAPWRKPCEFELRAAVQAMLARDDAGSEAEAEAGVAEADSLAVVFLLDTSGSVGDDEFAEMTGFLQTAAAAAAAQPRHKLAVVQFSSDSRVEVGLGPLDQAAFDGAIASMKRINGGTNIAAAIAKAGSLLKAEPASARRVLVLLTDGRIDSYQAREAAAMAARLADEQANVGLWAFGVGRGVDAAEIQRILEGPQSCKKAGAERYHDLMVRDDAPW